MVVAERMIAIDEFIGMLGWDDGFHGIGFGFGFDFGLTGEQKSARATSARVCT